MAQSSKFACQIRDRDARKEEGCFRVSMPRLKYLIYLFLKDLRGAEFEDWIGKL